MSSPRVLASQLPSHDGRSVTLLGLAASASADASTAVFTAADGKQVAVSLGPAAHASALVVGMPYDVVGVVQQGRINAVGTDCCRVPQSSRKRSSRFNLRLESAFPRPSLQLTLSSCVAASVLRTTHVRPPPRRQVYSRSPRRSTWASTRPQSLCLPASPPYFERIDRRNPLCPTRLHRGAPRRRRPTHAEARQT
jgi:hypothetical protein